MGIPIRFITVVIKKSAIEERYPGGLEYFLNDWPDLLQDEQLVGRCYMSTGEADGFLDVLRSIGFDLPKSCAVADMFAGVLDPCEGIDITHSGTELFGGCEATFSGDRRS